MAPSAPLSGEYLPRRLGDRYVLLKELGHGGMGQVFMAVTGAAGISRVCALKVIRRFDEPGGAAEEMTQRFLDEAKVVTQLTHENLVYVFDFGLVDRQGYLAMEYVAGKTLTEIWNRCAQVKVGLPTGPALFLMAELCAALGYAHRAGGLGLVHRDISPSNLMVTYTGGLKIIDFGLAQWKSKLAETATGINWGKVSYMSPEQQCGQPVDHRSDLFSAGVVLWELLTGRALFPSADARASLGEVPPPSRFNRYVFPGLDQVALRALATAPAERFQSGEEMSAAIASEMGRDGGKLATAAFIEKLFGLERTAEAEEQEALLANARAQGEGLPQGLGPAEPVDPLMGTVLAERYLVRRLVGEGAMGRVYEGLHTGIGRRVAIKLPRGTAGRRNELLERFRREAQAASRIGHPNIADVTDCGTTPGGDFFFVMEFIDGADLEALLRRDGAFAVERALLIAIQTARALEAAHQAGIVHRDLKPSNVMLVAGRDDELAKVLDFGVAKSLREEGGGEEDAPGLTRANAVVGTPRYMAPEQIAGGDEVDFRADIYGLGGILYAMLSGGRAPVEGDGLAVVWHRKLNQDPAPLAQHRHDLPVDLEALIMRCLARDPAERPSSMTAVKKELVATLERARTPGRTALPLRAPSRTEPARPARSAWVRPALLAGAAVLAATAGATLWRWPAPEPSVSKPAENRSAGSPSFSTERRPMTTPAPIPVPSEPAAQKANPPEPPPTRPAERASAMVKPAAPPAPTIASDGEAKAGRALPASGAPRPSPVPTRNSQRPSSPSGEASVRSLLAEAEALFQRGQLVGALDRAEKALPRGGVPALLMLGKIYFEMEDFAQAREAYAKALRVDPASLTAQRGLSEAKERLAGP